MEYLADRVRWCWARLVGVRGRVGVPRRRELRVEPDDDRRVGRVDGGSSPSEGVTSKMLEFTQCMRAHGELGFPDPSATGGFTIPNSVDDNSSTFRAAERACKDLAARWPARRRWELTRGKTAERAS
jgi:hypothetical protein